LPPPEHPIVFIIGVHAAHLRLLRVHRMVHVHEHLHLQRDLLHYVLLLSHVVALMRSEEGALGAYTRSIKDTDKLQGAAVLRAGVWLG
jgi:hypothetical protein